MRGVRHVATVPVPRAHTASLQRAPQPVHRRRAVL